MNDNDGSELRTLTVANLGDAVNYLRGEFSTKYEVMVFLGFDGLARLVKVQVDHKNKRLILIPSIKEFEGWRANQ